MVTTMRSIPCGYCCPCGVYGAICWPLGGTIPGCAPFLYGCIWDGGASGCWYPLWVAIGEWLIRVGPLPSDWPLEGRGGIGMFCWPVDTQNDRMSWRQLHGHRQKFYSFLAFCYWLPHAQVLCFSNTFLRSTPCSLTESDQWQLSDKMLSLHNQLW